MITLITDIKQLRRVFLSGDIIIRGGEISKMYTCPRTTGCKKALVRTKALPARTQINTKTRFVNIMI